MQNKLLEGKDNTQRIVSIEIDNDVAMLYIQTENGSIIVEPRPNRFWILSNEKLDPKYNRLKGELHYKWGKQFTDRQDYYNEKRLLKNKDIFNIYDPKEAFMIKDGATYYKGLKHSEVTILSFDIETTTLEHNDDARVLLISNTFRKNGQLERKLFDFKDYFNEGEMLEDWCQWILIKDPSIICGHNIQSFDFPYLRFIADKHDVKLELGRDSSKLKVESFESKFRKDGSQFYHYNKSKIYGREIVDTFFLALKYDVGRKYESYGLKQIIKQEGLEIKDRQFYDAAKIRHNYNDPVEWEKIKAYALHDADDSLALFDLMAPPLFYSAQIIPKSFQLITESAEGSKINSIMMRSYLQEGHSLPKESEAVKYPGAISIGNPGIYRNVFKIDVASLYPSIMIQYEVYDPIKDPNGSFLDLVKQLTEQRLKNKEYAKSTGNRYFKDMEQSQKILINSAYGFCGATGLLFNSPAKAAFVTEKGREILQKSIDWALNKGFKLVNADTDSISFSKGNETPFSKEERLGLLNEINSMFPDRIKFEDDGYYPCLIVIMAKNYVLQTEDGQIKYKGSAIKATGREPALQQLIKDIIGSILDGKQNYLEIYNRYVKEALNVQDINRWASKKTVTSKVLEGTRTNETKVKDAIENTEYAEGDKIYVYFDEESNLKLAENFDGKYNKDKLLEKLYKTALTFETIINKETFINYKLKKNKKLLENV